MTATVQAANALTRRERLLFLFFALEIAIVVFLQKIAIPGVGVDVTLALLAPGLIGLLVTGLGSISRIRLTLVLIFFAFAAISQLLAIGGVSATSVSLLFVLYAAILVRIDVSWALYAKSMNYFQTIMLVIGAIVMVEDIWQFTFGWNSFPNIDHLLPKEWLNPGYVYIQPIKYGSAYMKPSALFLKEASFVSQFTAISVAIEIAFFRRLWHIAFFVAVLFACFAGTGLLLLVFISPVMLLRLPPRASIPLIVLALIALASAFGLGWYDSVSQRLAEVQDSTSSSSMRFIAPFQVLEDFVRHGGSVLWGNGAGSTPSVGLYVPLPVVKLMLEYGFFAAAAFYAMFIYALFDRKAEIIVASALFINFNLGGGYLLVPVVVNLCILLGTLFRPVGGRPGVSAMRDLVRWSPRYALRRAQLTPRPSSA